MSVAALSWAFERQMTDPTAKSVLVALADHADERGRCWPSIGRLRLFTALSGRTVQYALQRLQDMGAISREERPGQSNNFVVDFDWAGQSLPPQHVRPSTTCTPARDAGPPLQEVRGRGAPRAPTPAPRAPEPSRTIIEPSVEPSLGERAHGRPRNARRREGTRISPDWQLDDGLRAYAQKLGLDPDAVAAAFLDHWLASDQPTAWKRDWSAAFRTWCRNEVAGGFGGRSRFGGGRAREQDSAGGIVESGLRVAARRGLV